MADTSKNAFDLASLQEDALIEDADHSQVDVVETSDPAPVDEQVPDPEPVTVKLVDSIDEPVVISVANHPDLELAPGKDYDVPVDQSQLLVESRAVEVVE